VGWRDDRTWFIGSMIFDMKQPAASYPRLKVSPAPSGWQYQRRSCDADLPHQVANIWCFHGTVKRTEQIDCLDPQPVSSNGIACSFPSCRSLHRAEGLFRQPRQSLPAARSYRARPQNGQSTGAPFAHNGSHAEKTKLSLFSDRYPRRFATSAAS